MTGIAAKLTHLPALLRDRSPHGRRALLHCVTDLYMSGAHSCTDTVRDGFGLLLADLARRVDATARAELATRLETIPNAPPALLKVLLADRPAIAAPAPASNLTLSEAELAATLSRRGGAHAVVVASRRGLSAALVRKIVAQRHSSALEALAENADAPLQRADFDALMHAATTHPRLQRALIARTDLPADVALRLLWHVSTPLAGQALQRALTVTPDTLALAMEIATAQGFADTPPHAHPPAALHYADAKQARGELGEALLVRLVQDGEMDRFYACLEQLASVTRTVATCLMDEPSGYALAILCKAAGFDRSTFLALAHSWRAGAQRSTEQTYALMMVFKTIDRTRAERLLECWKTVFGGGGARILRTQHAYRQAG